MCRTSCPPAMDTRFAIRRGFRFTRNRPQAWNVPARVFEALMSKTSSGKSRLSDKIRPQSLCPPLGPLPAWEIDDHFDRTFPSRRHLIFSSRKRTRLLGNSQIEQFARDLVLPGLVLTGSETPRFLNSCRWVPTSTMVLVGLRFFSPPMPTRRVARPQASLLGPAFRVFGKSSEAETR